MVHSDNVEITMGRPSATKLTMVTWSKELCVNAGKAFVNQELSTLTMNLMCPVILQNKLSNRQQLIKAWLWA